MGSDRFIHCGHPDQRTGPQCAMCGDIGRHADGATVVFCRCAAGQFEERKYVDELAREQHPVGEITP